MHIKRVKLLIRSVINPINPYHSKLLAKPNNDILVTVNAQQIIISDSRIAISHFSHNPNHNQSYTIIITSSQTANSSSKETQQLEPTHYPVVNNEPQTRKKMKKTTTDS